MTESTKSWQAGIRLLLVSSIGKSGQKTLFQQFNLASPGRKRVRTGSVASRLQVICRSLISSKPGLLRDFI